MILYLDTSALVKLYAEEPGTEEMRSAVEARSALARKEREGALSEKQHDEAVERLKRDFREAYLSRRLTGGIVAHAGELAREHALRAYDSVHLATALVLREEARELSARRRKSVGAAVEESRESRVLLMSYDSSLIKAARKEAFAYEPGASPARGQEKSR